MKYWQQLPTLYTIQNVSVCKIKTYAMCWIHASDRTFLNIKKGIRTKFPPFSVQQMWASSSKYWNFYYLFSFQRKLGPPLTNFLKSKNQLWRNKNFILRKITIIDLRSHVLQKSHIPQELMNYLGNQSNQCIWDLLVVLP